MAKRAASPAPVNEQLSDSAKKHLTTLRGEIESRLAMLEEVLADPSRGESLAGLILDLSRIATEEAQAAAAQACLTTRTEADRQMAEHRAAATAAIETAQATLRSAYEELETERATTQELRHEAERARADLEKQSALAAGRGQLERDLQAAREELGRGKTAVADLKRSAADIQQHFEAERKSRADLESQLEAERQAVATLRKAADDARESTEHASERLAALDQALADARAANEEEQRESRSAHEQALKEAAAAQQRALAHAEAIHEQARADARAAYDAISQDLERERTAAAYAHAELQSQVDSLRGELDAEKAQAEQLRRTAEHADELTASLDRERAAAAERERTADERELAATADRERAYAELQAQVDNMRAELGTERERADADVQSQIDRLRAELEAERARTGDLQEALQQAEERQASLDRESSHGLAEQGELELRQRELAELSQAALTEAHRALARAQADLEQERASNAELMRAAESVDQQLASSRSNEVQMLANVDQLAAQLERERAEATSAIQMLISERDGARGDLQAAQKWIEEVRAAEAEFTPRPSAAAAAKAKPAPPSEDETAEAAGAAPVPSDEVWQELRLTSRHYFKESIPVQINGDTGTLFDLSISGCQLLSPSALKPNQAIKIQLPGKPPIHCAGKVVWTRLEAAASAQLLSYRAGVRFTKADAGAIESFTAEHATSPVPVAH